MRVKKLTPNEVLKYQTERQLLVNEIAEYLIEKYLLPNIKYRNMWMKNQEFVKHFNKFGSMFLK